MSMTIAQLKDRLAMLPPDLDDEEIVIRTRKGNGQNHYGFIKWVLQGRLLVDRREFIEFACVDAKPEEL